MKKKFLLLLVILGVTTVGCAQKRMYYWGNYSSTLYDYRKNTSDATLLKHMQELENIVVKSKDNNKRVPPGLYGELGYFYLKTNKKKKAIEYFNLEKQLYPESSVLMNRLIQKSEAFAKSSDEETPQKGE